VNVKIDFKDSKVAQRQIKNTKPSAKTLAIYIGGQWSKPLILATV
jgi:hypothetical protein